MEMKKGLNLPENITVSLAVNSAVLDNKRKIEDAYLLHKKLVFDDPEFKTKIDSIKSSFTKSTKKRRQTGVLHQTIGLPSNPFSAEQLKEITELVANFGVSSQDIIHYINGLTGASSVPVDRVAVEYSQKLGLYIRIAPGATKSEIESAVENIDDMMEMVYGHSKPMHKPPQNYKLVYAVFRARMKNKKFSEIYAMYEKGGLPLYNGARSLKSEDSLERYYRKYKPKTDT